MKWLRRLFQCLRWPGSVRLPNIETALPNGLAAHRAEREAQAKLRADAPTMREARRAVDSFTASIDRAMRGQRP